MPVATLSLGHAMALQLLRRHCRPPATVVDAGAYPGTLARAMAEEGWRVVALDTDPARDPAWAYRFVRRESFDRAAGTARPFAEVMRAAGVTTYAVDLESDTFPLSDDSVDAVLMTEVIEHLWVNPLHALAEVNRILRPDGVLVLTTPNLLSLRNRLAFLRGDMQAMIEHPALAFVKKVTLGHVGHVRLYSATELSGMLRLMGFDPSVTFEGFYYWQGDTSDPTAPKPVAATSRRPRWLKTPRELRSAAAATAIVLAERLHPAFRGHLFVVAHRRRRVSLADLTPDASISAL